MFGRKRLTAAYIAACAVAPTEAMAQIIKSLDDFRQDRPFSDDVTLLLLEFAAESQ